MASKKRYDARAAVLKNLAPPSGESSGYWEANFEFNDKDRLVASLRNAFLILKFDDRWAGVLAYDEFANQVVKLEKPPFDGGAPGPWSDIDDLRTAIWLSHHYRVNFKRQMITDTATAVAAELCFHPVRDYLKGLKWDGEPRLRSWLARYLGAREGEYPAAAGAKFLIGAVARVMRPGCKMDNMLILEGAQGRWKSTALGVLAGDWFMDTPFTLGDKDAYLALRGKWIVEMAELDALGRAEASRHKAFLSSNSDTFRAPYQIWARTIPRQCVFAGTVNHGTYLRDITGNRRFWPVRIERAAIDELREARDQIWAEALAEFEKRTPWWLEPEERELFEAEQELRYIGDAYADVVAEFLTGQSETTMEILLGDGLKLDKSKWTVAEQMRLGGVMEKLGWEKRRRSTGRRDYFYAKRERVPGEEG